LRHRILLTLKPVDGALVRVVALAERRGFSIRELSTILEKDSRDVVLEVVSADRSVDNLCRQLSKLHDVVEVCLPSEPEVQG
jgi:acetolactate synthase II small subunit